MNKVLYCLLWFVLVGAMLISCNKYENKYTYDGDNYVQLTESNGTFFVLNEQGISYDIVFSIIGSPAGQDITMPIEFPDSAEQNGKWIKPTIKPGKKGISMLSEKLTIPAGKYSGAFKIEALYDSLTFGEIDTILVRIDDGTVETDKYHNLFLLKVLKFYPYVGSEFPGQYSGTYRGEAMKNYTWGEVGTKPGLKIVLGSKPNTLVVTNGFYMEQADDWGEEWVDGPKPVTLFMNTSEPSNFKIEISEPAYLGTTKKDGEEFIYWVSKHPKPGSFNAATKELTIKFYMTYNGPDVYNDQGEYKVTLDNTTAEALITAMELKK